MPIKEVRTIRIELCGEIERTEECAKKIYLCADEIVNLFGGRVTMWINETRTKSPFGDV